MNLQAEIKKKPLKIYDNLLFISSEAGTVTPIEADFMMAGDTAQLMTAIVIQMNRHPALAEVLEAAVTVYQNQEA